MQRTKNEMITDKIKEVDTEAEEKKALARLEKNKRLRSLGVLRRVPQKHYIMTTRFNNKSHSEMLNYCGKIKGVKCIYGVPKEISAYVAKDSILFVFEMNNEENRIEGLGMVKNIAYPSRYGVYEDCNYNRFSYLGKARIDRCDMSEEEESIMKAMDIICFTGKFHQKRSHGITVFPLDLIEKFKEKLNMTEYVANMFKNRLSN